jgi:hypothetical protein
MNWEQTPAEVPNAKLAKVDPHVALRLLLEHIIGRLRVIDRAQVYLINQIEKPPPDSLVERERFALEAKTSALLRQWIYAHEHDHAYSADSDRPSQNNIAINIVEPSKSVQKSSPPTFSRTKVIVYVCIAVGSTIFGFLQARGILK